MLGATYLGRTYIGDLGSGRSSRTGTDSSNSSDASIYSPLGAARTGFANDVSTSGDIARRSVFRRTVQPGYGGAYFGGQPFGAYTLGYAPSGADQSLTSDRARLSAVPRVSGFTNDTSLTSESAHRTTHGVAFDYSFSRDRIIVQRIIPLGGAAPVSIRDRAPLRLDVLVTTPSGRKARWGADDPRPGNAPSGITISTAMPGGFENFGCSLARNPARAYSDLAQLSKVQVVGLGSEVAWEGRLESLPDQGGEDSFAINPSGVGYQSALDDNNAVRELIVERNISSWRGPSVQRQIWQIQNQTRTSNGPSVGPDTAPGVQPLPALITEIDGDWTAASQSSEAWYDARGIPIGELYAAWETNGVVHLDGNFVAEMGLGTTDTTDPATSSGGMTADPGTHTLTGGSSRLFAMVRLLNALTAGGTAGLNAQVFWTVLALYGNHGLPLHGSFTANDAPGVLASDVVPYLLGKWAPQIGVGQIDPSTFVIPEAVWLDPGTLSAIIKDLVKYELLDWAVWEGPLFHMNARGARGRKWRARTGPAKLSDAGPQISRLWNGVVVTWNDVTGLMKSIGPPGSGCDFEDASLLDADPQNPVNQAGIERWARAQLGVSTQAGALSMGQIFLQEQKLLDTAGQAEIVGHCEDENGVFWPAWMMRAGDQISFIDAADSSYRRIVHTSYADSSYTNTLQLDQPPDSFQAILERLNIVIQPYGL